MVWECSVINKIKKKRLSIRKKLLNLFVVIEMIQLPYSYEKSYLSEFTVYFFTLVHLNKSG